MTIPAFNEDKYFKNSINNNSEVLLIEGAEACSLDDYTELFIKDGFTIFEKKATARNSFVALNRENEGVFINYYGALNELTIVKEYDSKYFEFTDIAGEAILPPQITQLHLEDFGMSYAIRLSDGRYILIDGGREFVPDAERLYECIKAGSPHEKPIIAAWIMTHPHSDHFHCFIKFFDMFSDDVVIERFMYTFPEHDDVEHYPSVMTKNARFVDSSIFTNIPLMEERIAKTDAEVFSPHTGQRYVIGDAVLDILASIDDTIHRSQNVNATSLVIRMELGGQVVLWGADASFEEARILEKYGNYLKADILQVPHHGFRSGSTAASIECYKVIAPEVCLLPVSDLNAYTLIDIYIESTRFLMQSPGVKEIITGDTTRTITLPYKAPDYAKAEIERKYQAGLSASGSNVCVFSGLDTSRSVDFVFSFLNMARNNATVWAELLFENADNAIRFIKIPVPHFLVKTLSIIGDEVDSESLYFNWMSLKTKGIPENSAFAVRFISDVPIVITHKEHTPSYTSPNNNL